MMSKIEREQQNCILQNFYCTYFWYRVQPSIFEAKVTFSKLVIYLLNCLKQTSFMNNGDFKNFSLVFYEMNQCLILSNLFNLKCYDQIHCLVTHVMTEFIA